MSGLTFHRLIAGVCLLAWVRIGGAQEQPKSGQPKPISSIYDVHTGMPRDTVLAGLSEHYSLTVTGRNFPAHREQFFSG